jgi:hypothetical protein
MPDRDVEGAADSIDQVVLEPMRPILRQRAYHDLVGIKPRKGTAGREQRNAISDLDTDRTSMGLEYCQGIFATAA